MFGTPQTSSPLSSTTTFGASSSAAFGSTMPLFGASSTSTFGSSSPSFGGSSLFGDKPASGGFGSSTQTSPFGSTNQQSQPAFGSDLFGSPTPFGSGSTQSPFSATSSPAFCASTISTFGSSSTSSFGANNTMGFGAGIASSYAPTTASAFGTTATPGFGTGTGFGVSSTPVFGSGGGFGASSTTFVASTTFGTLTTPTFGTTTVAPPFGSTAFGTSISPSFGFGSTTGQSTSAFGSSPFGTTTTFPFSSQSSSFDFGSTSSFAGNRGGSRVVAYSSTPETYDGAGQPGKLESISAMSEYKVKSHEELQWDDYQLGDKGGPLTPGQSFGGFNFGIPSAPSNPFANTSTLGESSVFGSTSSFSGNRGGSRVVAYSSTPETDGSAGQPGKLESISAMSVYKDKSHEELRWEDYQLGYKGGLLTPGQSSGGVNFSMPSAPSNIFVSTNTLGQPSAGPFSSTVSSNPFETKSFGATSAPTFSPSPFTAAPSSNSFQSAAVFGSTSSPAFPSNRASSTFNTSTAPSFASGSSLFTSSAAQTTSSPLGNFANTQSSVSFPFTIPNFLQKHSFRQVSSSFPPSITPGFKQFNTPFTGFALSNTPSLMTSSSQGIFSETNMSREEETPIDEDHNPQVDGPSNRQVETNDKKEVEWKAMNLRSLVWAHFTQFKDEDGSWKGKCNYCGVVYCCDNNKNNGTNHLTYHIERCKIYNSTSVDQEQTELTFKIGNLGEESRLGTWEFDQEAIRKALTFMVIVDELPLKFVVSEGFKYFMSICCPRFKIPSRFTVLRDFLNLYVDEKTRLQSLLKSSNQRVCLTIDKWTTIQRINYMCVTIHYIDSDWKLSKKIINFSPISSHKGRDIGREVERCLLDWGIDKITTITVDNASSNDTAIEYLQDKIHNWGKDILGSEHIHMRCIAHIVNLIVVDGLKEISDSVKKVRDVVRYVRQSPTRLKMFKGCVESERIQCKSSLCLDVPTRWDSTYLMLDTTFKLKKAIERYVDLDPHFTIDVYDNELELEAPNKIDWESISKIIIFLKHFYELTLKISGSKYVTPNIFFQEICYVHFLLNYWIENGDTQLSTMAANMKEKYDKYWGNPRNVNKYIYVAAILDPRFKMEWIEFVFNEMYDPKLNEEMTKDMRSFLMSLFNEYKKELAPESVIEQNVQLSIVIEKDKSDPTARAEAVLQGRLQKFRQGVIVGKSEVDKYLSEAIEDNVVDFDVLLWWKNNSARLPILSQVARDVLSIPISTVAFESCFSSGGRVLDSFRSSLTPKTVQSLICTQDWIRSSESSSNVEEDLQEIENLEKEFQTIILEPSVDL